MCGLFFLGGAEKTVCWGEGEEAEAEVEDEEVVVVDEGRDGC